MSMNRFFAGFLALGLLATPAVAQQQQPQPPNVERTKNGAWTVECVKNQQGQRLCRMVQNVVHPKTKKPLMKVFVDKPSGPGDAQLKIIVPLGIWLRPGLEFSIDGGSASRMAFEFCLEEGCLARLNLTAGLVSALKRGSGGKVALQNIRRQTLNLTVSLSGFTKSFNAL